MADVLSWGVGRWRGCKGRWGNRFMIYVKGKDKDAGRGSWQNNEGNRVGVYVFKCECVACVRKGRVKLLSITVFSNIQIAQYIIYRIFSEYIVLRNSLVFWFGSFSHCTLIIYKCRMLFWYIIAIKHLDQLLNYTN